jgi:KDO2-lipid IV(A) lauroyltransferase
VVVAAFRAAWAVLWRLPEPVAHGLFALAADVATARGGRGVRQLRANLRRAVPDADEAALARLTRAAMRSYARYWCDVFRLPSWTAQRLRDTTRVEGLQPLAAALREGSGAIGFLGHLGSWDHVGAWAAQELAPVTTVAERLRPEELFALFERFRGQLGIQALALSGSGTSGVLVRRLRRGGFVPLLADRDLTSTGVPVQLLGEPASAAAGPAALALMSGAPLFPVTVRYERLPRRPGARGWAGPRWGVVATVHPAVPVPERGAGGRSAQVAAMTQACVDALSAAVRSWPADWHVLQPVFDADRRPPGAGADRRTGGAP